MSAIETIARLEHWLRPVLHTLPPHLAVRLFSDGRTAFAKAFADDVPQHAGFHAPSHMAVRAWGLEFSMPIWNAAGMFKNGEGYEVVARQGAGAYVAGTTTSVPRVGNVKDGIRWPAAAYPRSGVASNWMGLPNEGHAAVAARLSALTRVAGCPVGASVSADPGMDQNLALPALAKGMRLYDRVGVDYIELNESCPNVPGHDAQHDVLDAGLLQRLDYVAHHVLATRTRNLPVVVKFSTDTNPAYVDDLVRVLIERGFDGIILGNTSTQYVAVRPLIDKREQAVYDHFTRSFGGGLSGRPLRDVSLELCARARRAADACAPTREFHVIRCGGVSTAADIEASRREGILLNQWYVGYFDAFGVDGHNVYRRLAAQLVAMRT
ncbi:MAG: hypothetical protein FGM24_00250 [Candidatus Kapabacteria bacterium]|nr:hypothetical protein [Candidatus Kapabacteria bacterium]